MCKQTYDASCTTLLLRSQLPICNALHVSCRIRADVNPAGGRCRDTPDIDGRDPLSYCQVHHRRYIASTVAAGCASSRRMDGFRCPSPKGVLTKQDPAMFAVVLSLLLSVPWASAVRWSPQSFPNPLHDVNSCGRYGKPSWICDPDHILSEYNQDLVEGSIHEIAEGPYKTAHCSAGYQVRVSSACLGRALFVWSVTLPSAVYSRNLGYGCRWLWRL